MEIMYYGNFNLSIIIFVLRDLFWGCDMSTEAKASDNHSEEPPEPPEWMLWVKAAVYIAIWVVFLQVAKRGVLAIWPRVSGFLHVWWVTLIGTALLLFIGIGLFFFKKLSQRLYGLAEVGFALAVGWASVVRARSTSDAASWLAVLASAYLIVRGLSNYQEGKEERRTRLRWEKLIKK